MSPKLNSGSTSDDVIAVVAAANPFPAHAAHLSHDVAVRARDRRLVAKKALIVACVLLAVAAPAYAMRGAVGDLLSLESRGQPVDESNTSLRTLTGLRGLGLSENIRRVATQDGYDFYVGRTQSRHLCFAVAPHGQRPAVTACGTSGSFPSPAHPVLDFSMFRAHEEGARPIASHILGFAADGVKRVGVAAVNGQTYWTEVRRNVYAFRPAPIGVTRLLAEAADGQLVFEKAVSGPGN